MLTTQYRNRIQLNIKVKQVLTEKDMNFILNCSMNDSLGFIAATKDELDFIKSHPDNFYIAFYENIPVGMFALFDFSMEKEINKRKLRVNELDYLYIIPQVRGLGIGHFLVQEAKKIAKANNADLVVLQTLDPALNHFYKKNGATIVSDSQYPKDLKTKKHPTTFLKINLGNYKP